MSEREQSVSSALAPSSAITMAANPASHSEQELQRPGEKAREDPYEKFIDFLAYIVEKDGGFCHAVSDVEPAMIFLCLFTTSQFVCICRRLHVTLALGVLFRWLRVTAYFKPSA